MVEERGFYCRSEGENSQRLESRLTMVIRLNWTVVCVCRGCSKRKRRKGKQTKRDPGAEPSEQETACPKWLSYIGKGKV